MIRKSFLVGLLLAVVCAMPATSHSEEYKIAVLAFTGADKALKEWKPTADYLTAKLGKNFVILPLNDAQLKEAVNEGKVEFFLTNPAVYVEMNKLKGAQAVATMVRLSKNQPTDVLSTCLFTRKDSPIKTAADFKGKVLMTRGKSSFASWLTVKRIFVEKGLDPDKDLKEIRDAQELEHVVFGVLNGAVDGGCAMAGALEKMAEEGKIKMADFSVIDQVTDNFPYAHTTPLYPEWPMAATSLAPATLRTDVGEALCALAATDPAAAAAKIGGWKKPLDYSSVVECLTVVRYGPFAKK
jgi:two-component system, LuxR family, sensor histidine kinase TtrS